jgi:hypothetical protein
LGAGEMQTTGETKESSHPQISEKTLEEMAKFFMKTSIPRILEERRKANGNNSSSKS